MTIAGSQSATGPMPPRPARIAVTGRHVLYVYFASKQAISASAMATLRSAKVCVLARTREALVSWPIPGPFPYGTEHLHCGLTPPAYFQPRVHATGLARFQPRVTLPGPLPSPRCLHPCLRHATAMRSCLRHRPRCSHPCLRSRLAPMQSKTVALAPGGPDRDSHNPWRGGRLCACAELASDLETLGRTSSFIAEPA